MTEPNVARMGQHSLERWPQLLQSLATPVYFQRNGTLIVWHRQDGPRPSAGWPVRQKLPPQHQPGRAPSNWMPSAWPPLSLALQALSGGHLAAGTRASWTTASCCPPGGRTAHPGRGPALAQPQRAERLRPGQPGQPDLVLDCRGLGASTAWPQLRGVRGEVIRVHAPEVTLQRPTRLIHPRYSLYIAPKENHVFVIGATEIESSDAGPASLRSMMERSSALDTVHSGFAEARIRGTEHGCADPARDLPALRRVGQRRACRSMAVPPWLHDEPHHARHHPAGTGRRHQPSGRTDAGAGAARLNFAVMHILINQQPVVLAEGQRHRGRCPGAVECRNHPTRWR